MIAEKKKHTGLKRRKWRVRRKVVAGPNRPRLQVCRTLAHIYAQIVEEGTGKTLAAVSTTQSGVREGLKTTSNIEAAKCVGKAIAEAALARDITSVCFDRGGRKYHGRVKALADAAREAGLKF